MRAWTAVMAGQRRHLVALHEAAAGLAALALSGIVVAHLAASDRAALLYSDGDSLVTVLVSRSLLAGEPQDWAMSSVLFLPEIALLLLLLILGLPIIAALTINALVNLLALYAALRFVARRPAAALAGFAGFSLLALLDSTASRESIELASLMATTTYYAATVIGVLLTIGLLLRLPARPWIPVTVAAVALVCTASNPIYIAWAVLPLTLLLVAARHLPVRVRLVAMAALVGGAVLGLLVRVPMAPWIANTGVGYAQPLDWVTSARYYGDLVADRMTDAAGIASVVAVCILVVLGCVLTALALRRGDTGLAALAAVSWMVPLAVVIGAIALGTHAARYLQPAAFLPVLALVVLARMLRPVPAAVLPSVAVVLAAIAAAVSPPLVVAASRQHPSDDVACVADWVARSGRVGAGQFWTVRAPKAYAENPAQLVQVDFRLGAYAWLVNRSDFAPGAVSFLVVDDQSVPFELPEALDGAKTQTVDCGSYRILDFGGPVVPLGDQHS